MMEKIDLKNFETNIILRQLTESDYESVVSLQLKCFPHMKPWSKEQFSSQVSTFQEGQLCVHFRRSIRIYMVIY